MGAQVEAATEEDTTAAGSDAARAVAAGWAVTAVTAEFLGADVAGKGNAVDAAVSEARAEASGLGRRRPHSDGAPNHAPANTALERRKGVRRVQ